MMNNWELIDLKLICPPLDYDYAAVCSAYIFCSNASLFLLTYRYLKLASAYVGSEYFISNISNISEDIILLLLG